MQRRRFISIGAALGVATASGLRLADAQNPAVAETPRRPVLVRAGISRRADETEGPKEFQQTVVRSFDSEGRLAALVIPVAAHGTYFGAPLHVHHNEDEWIHILGGEFVAEVGGIRMRLKTGDSLLMPKKIPHRWSVAGIPVSGAIHLYTPAGKMDLAFDDPPGGNVAKTPEQMKAEFENFGMTLLGAPLTRQEIISVG